MELPPPPYEDISKSQNLPSPSNNGKFYSKKKTMPIVYSCENRAALLFPSESSFNKYKHMNFENESSDLENGNLPLFQFTETSSFKRMFGKPSYVIYRFEVKRLDDATNEKPVYQNRSHGAYKMPFCSISRKRKKGRTVYTLMYLDKTLDVSHKLIKDNEIQLTYSGTINDTSFQYVSPNGKIDELILTMDSNDKIGSVEDGVTGIYTTEGRDLLPKKYSKFATLVVSEGAEQPFSLTNDISSDIFPLICQGLLINYFIRPIVYTDDNMEPHPEKSEIWDLLDSE